VGKTKKICRQIKEARRTLVFAPCFEKANQKHMENDEVSSPKRREYYLSSSLGVINKAQGRKEDAGLKKVYQGRLYALLFLIL